MMSGNACLRAYSNLVLNGHPFELTMANTKRIMPPIASPMMVYKRHWTYVACRELALEFFVIIWMTAKIAIRSATIEAIMKIQFGQ